MHGNNDSSINDVHIYQNEQKKAQRHSNKGYALKSTHAAWYKSEVNQSIPNMKELNQKQSKIEQSEQMFQTLQTLIDTSDYTHKVHSIIKKGEEKDKQALDQMELQLKQESVLKKWEGSGLEQEIFNEYVMPKSKTQPVSERNFDIPETRELPSTKKQKDVGRDKNKKQKKEPLFPKTSTFISFDGTIQCDQPLQFYTIDSSSMNSYKKTNCKNKIQSLSRFFQLKQSAKPFSSVNAVMQANKGTANDIKVFQTSRNQLSIVQTEPKKQSNIKSQNLSLFGQKSDSIQRSIPMVKEWFESLEVSERILCLTTIDPIIVSHVKNMFNLSRKVAKQQQAKFKMNSSFTNINSQTKILNEFNLVNSQAYKSEPQVSLCEQELLHYIRITDTLSLHDTLTITPQLVQDPHSFYQIGETIVGKNFLKAPHEVRWLKEESEGINEFECCAPLWLNMHDPNSLASWVLYFMERCLFIQYQINVHSNFLECRDNNNKSILLTTDSKNIALKHELLPFWRSFCDSIQTHSESADEYVARVKSKAITIFDVSSEPEFGGISHFHGGLQIDFNKQSFLGNQQVENQINEFANKLTKCIENNNSEKHPQIEFNNLCLDSLHEASLINCLNMGSKLGESLLIPTFDNKNQMTDKHSVQMMLERIFVDTFRDKINLDLKSKFVSTNKKVQKRKIKKLKQKEQQLELEREQQKLSSLAKQQSEQPKAKITIKNEEAIQMLINDIEDTPKSMNQTWTEQQSNVVNQKKKNKHKKNKNQAKKKEEQPGSEVKEVQYQSIIEDINAEFKPIKTSTPKFNKQEIKTQPNQSVDPQNYFQMLNHKYALSLESQAPDQSCMSDVSGALTTNLAIEKFSRQGTIQTQCTSKKSKELNSQLPTDVTVQIEYANSNDEVLQLISKYQQPQNQGNSNLNKTKWQRHGQAISGIINELVSESSHNSDICSPRMDVIQVEVNNNQIVSPFDQKDPTSSKSSVNSDKKIIQFKKRQNQRIIPRQVELDSNDSSEIDSELDLLPDLHTNTLQPRDNDSSDCEQDDESLDDEDQSSIANSHTIHPPNHKPKISSKNKSKAAKQKSIRSANMRRQMEQNSGNMGVMIPEVIKYKWKIQKSIPAVTIQYISFAKSIVSEWKEQKNNKKTKKQRQLEWQKQFGNESQSKNANEVIMPSFEIIKPSEVKQNESSIQLKQNQEQPGAGKKQKQKKKDHKDVIEQFMKKMHKEDTPLSSIPKLSQNKPSSEKIKKTEKSQNVQSNSTSDEKLEEKQFNQNASDQKQQKVMIQKKSKINDQNNQERISSLEESTIIKAGFEYKAKKVQSKPTQSTPKQGLQTPQKQSEPNITKKEKKKEPQQEVKIAQQNNSASKPTKTDLNLESKEFIAGPKNLEEVLEDNKGKEETQEKETQKKKKKKNRSNKAKKKNQGQNNFMIDPFIGQQLYNMSQDQSYFDDSGINPIQNMLMENPQMQNLLQTLNQQVIAQQQYQIEEIKQKEQQDAQNQLIEDCQPCPEIDSDRYEIFFEQLEDQMKNRIKEIDQLKDSVRKERQGFIQIVENLVKNTFQNRYGNGFVGIKIFGSMATELAIETSDVDLVVTGINQTSNGQGNHRTLNKNQLLKMMQKLHDNLVNLKNENKIYQIKFIDTASVPIIKLIVDLQQINEWQTETIINQLKSDQNEDSKSEINLKEMGLETKKIDSRIRYLKVDISIDESGEQFQKFNYNSFNHRTHSGIETIYHIQELVKQRKDLRPIVMIIKKIFDSTFLSMPYYGGISSFSLVLMVSAYLKRFDSQKMQSLSTNLSGFFHFYGVGFKPDVFYLHGDSIEFLEEGQARPFEDPFIVLDPLDPDNNTSHSAFRFRDIQRALIEAFKIINTSCEQYQVSQDDSDELIFSPKSVLDRLMTEIKEEYQLITPTYRDEL